MSVSRFVVLCIPTILVTLVSDLVPWGVVTAAITLTLYAAVLFFPGKSLVRVNTTTALEALSLGETSIARDHVEIALREAVGSTNLATADLKLLRVACDKTVSALTIAGHLDIANALRERGEETIASLAQDAGQ